MVRKTLATLGICMAAHGSFIACNGAEFSSAGSDTAGSGGKASAGGSGTAGKATAGAGSNQGGRGGDGAASGGAPASGGETNPGAAGEADAGNGSGGSATEPGFQPPTEQLLYWFSADVGTTVEDGGVTAWKNRADNAVSAVQRQAGMQPTLMQADPLPMPLVSFDGVDDYMELPELTANFEAGLSVFIVAGARTTNSCAAFIELSNGIEIDDIHVGAHGNAAQYEIFQTVLQSEEGSFPVLDMHLVEAHHGAGVDPGVELRINGSQAGSTVMPLPASVPRSWNYLGRTVYETCVTFSGGVAELLMYSRKVTAEERTAIELYLVEKWQCCT